MHWSKYGVLCLILIVMSSVGYFGAKAGYSVKWGVAPDSPAWGELVAGHTYYNQTTDTWSVITDAELAELEAERKQVGILDVLGYLTNLSYFNITGMPFEITLIFDIILLMAGMIVLSLVRGTD